MYDKEASLRSTITQIEKRLAEMENSKIMSEKEQNDVFFLQSTIYELEKKLSNAAVFEYEDGYKIVRCKQIQKGFEAELFMWKVMKDDACLSKLDGQFYYEPAPSSRDAQFIIEFRFSTFDAAQNALNLFLKS